MKILAMDIGTFNSVACIKLTGGDAPAGQGPARPKRDERFVTLATTREAVARLIDGQKPDVMAIEVCPQAHWLSELGGSMGVKVLVANTADERWRWRNQRRKNDRDDARRLARMVASDDLPTVHMPSAQTREWRELIARRNRHVQLLVTIPGVAERTAEAFVAAIDGPARFASGRKVGCYLGLTPRQYDSGQTRRNGRISRQGNRHARAMLVEAAWMAMRYNPHLRKLYERLSRGLKTRRKQAIVAIARRLAVMMWAMLRRGERWCPPVGGARATG